MAPSFVAYIDESGHEAGNVETGATDWFILSAVVVRVENDASACSAVNEFRAAIGKDNNWTFSFKDLKEKRKVLFSRIIATKPVRAISILMHKPSNPIPNAQSEPVKLYHFTGKFLLERISALCRDSRRFSDAGNGKVHIVLSERRWFKYEDFISYLEWLKLSGNNNYINWDVIDLSLITTCKHNASPGCHLADAVAGATRIAVDKYDLRTVDHPLKGVTDDRSIRELKKIFYKYADDDIEGNGIKIWPPEAVKLSESAPEFDWLNVFF